MSAKERQEVLHAMSAKDEAAALSMMTAAERKAALHAMSAEEEAACLAQCLLQRKQLL